MQDSTKSADPTLESTADLLQRIRGGDTSARNRLIARFIPVLARWAHGRLRPGALGLMDTDDLVQTTMVRASSHLETFEPRGEGAFLAYLRKILINLIKDELRKRQRRPEHVALHDELLDGNPLPPDVAIGRDARERYECALARLSQEHQESIVLRIEFGYSYEQVAAAMHRPSANAARLMVSRALVKLAEEMREAG